MERNVYLWGDSIGKGVIYNEERKRYCLAKDRCSALITAAGIKLENHARMGATVADGYADFCETDVQPGSVAAIEFGGNDCDLDWDAVAEHPEAFHDGKMPLADFRALLVLFIHQAEQKHLSPMLVTPPPLISNRYYNWVCKGRDGEHILAYLGDVEHIYRWQERYAQAVREVAWQENVPLLDLRAVFLDQPNLTQLYCLDGIHPNERGQELMAKAVLSWAPGAVPMAV